MVETEEEFAARIGIDWADKKHDVCLVKSGSTKLERTVLKHTPESIDEWVLGLRERFGGRAVAVSVELTKGPIVSALLKYDFIVIFPVNPAALASYRKAWTPSGAKDDIRDAELVLDMLVKHPEQLKRLEPQSADMRALQQLVEQRRKLVNDRVRITNRLTYALKAYYPQALEWFEDKATKLFCDFLEEWPSVDEARRARRDKLEAFFRAHNVRRRDTIEERISAIKSATTLTEDPGVVRPAQLLVETMVGQLRPLLKAIGKFDDEIAALSKRLSDYEVFDSFPAAGDAFCPRLQAAFGEDRSRFDSAAEVQRYAGIAPVTEQSGQSRWVHWRFKCSKFLRQTFVEWAAQTIPHSFWAGMYYQQQRARGASHQGAVRSLAFKWIRILFRCWKTGTRYDESRYLKHLQSRGSKLFTVAVPHPENG
jgi:transposase